VRTHEVEFGGVVVVAGHEEVALVLVGGRVGGRGLRGRRQPLEIEFVGVPLAMHFGHYVLIVVVSETQEQADSLFNGSRQQESNFKEERNVFIASNVDLD